LQTELPNPSPSELSVLESVITAVTRSRRMRLEDAEDFRQTIHLRLAERRDDVFRRFNGRSSLRTYLFVVVHRMLLDWRNHALGRWRPSAAALRLGAVAVSLDRLIHRDGFSSAEAIAQLCSANPALRPDDLDRLAARLPARQTRRAALSQFHELRQTAEFEDPFEQRHRETEADWHRVALARALTGLSHEDRRLIWLRYRRGLSVSTVAARVGSDPKPLYRRFDRILLTLRRRLHRQGVTGADGREASVS